MGCTTSKSKNNRKKQNQEVVVSISKEEFQNPSTEDERLLQQNFPREQEISRVLIPKDLIVIGVRDVSAQTRLIGNVGKSSIARSTIQQRQDVRGLLSGPRLANKAEELNRQKQLDVLIPKALGVQSEYPIEAPKGSQETYQEGTLILEGIGRYFGTHFKQIPVGEGALFFFDGNYYTGMFENGTMEGFGILHTQNDFTYEGYFSKGMYHGEGILTHPDQDYNGFFEKGNKNGKGTLTFKKIGFEYTGNFVNNKPHGYGKLTNHTSQTYYEGCFINGEKHGLGAEKRMNGATIAIGNWDHGVFRRN